jgi:hypothetical protein
MNIERLQRVVEVRRIRLGMAEQALHRKRHTRDAAQVALRASRARQAGFVRDIDTRSSMLEQRRENGDDPVSALLRVEEFLKLLRLSLAREQVVGGRAESIVDQCQAELDQAALALWRCRHRLSHCETLLKRSVLHRQRRTELALEGTSAMRKQSSAMHSERKP